jgi:hypothetical protein
LGIWENAVLGVRTLIPIALLTFAASHSGADTAVTRTLVRPPHTGMKSAADHDEAMEVLNFIRVSSPDTYPPPTLYFSAGHKSTHITIYGVTRPSDQDLIVSIVRSEQAKRRWKPIYLLFVERENFIEDSRGWKERKGEKKLYSVILP